MGDVVDQTTPELMERDPDWPDYVLKTVVMVPATHAIDVP